MWSLVDQFGHTVLQVYSENKPTEVAKILSE